MPNIPTLLFSFPIFTPKEGHQENLRRGANRTTQPHEPAIRGYEAGLPYRNKLAVIGFHRPGKRFVLGIRQDLAAVCSVL